MERAVLPEKHPEVLYGRVGVLVINLGTPDGTDYWSMRRYLKEFLSDRRVIETNRLLWWPLLNGIILTTRPGKSGEAYDSIWNGELDESPLRTITRSQSEKLAGALGARLPNVIVDWAMRYGQPSIADRLQGLKLQVLRIGGYRALDECRRLELPAVLLVGVSEQRQQSGIVGCDLQRRLQQRDRALDSISLQEDSSQELTRPHVVWMALAVETKVIVRLLPFLKTEGEDACQQQRR